MSKEIGRNDKCPCMSGKKYKNCCEKTGIWENFKKQNLLYKDEQYVLSDLIDNDYIFKNLYLRERIKINKPVLFF